MSDLVIVESPAKAKTIQKYLGNGYQVVASMGHIRDLPKSKLGVDIENEFVPQYINIKGKEELISSLKKNAKKSDHVYLATDPDREGEAISWHLANLLGLSLDEDNRVTFNEITKTGVKNGMDQKRKIDVDLVDAQQARRVLDRIVGYQLSPFLWRKIRRGLSAGRVQSVAVRLIVDREEEIRAFKPQEYWTIDADFLKKGAKKTFPGKLYSKSGKKLKIGNEEESNAILSDLKNESYVVSAVKKGTRKKSPAPPFTTSTLQQEASRKLGFQARRTMKAAQELYEGVEVEGMGAVGLITYMRTDSLRISDEARDTARGYILAAYGDEFYPATPRVYRSRQNAQDAHEAIRPSLPELTPAQVKPSLTSDQFKLYQLIWNRFIASQMADAVYNTVNADITAGEYLFKASGFSVKFAGFTALYEESADTDDEKNTILPVLNVGDELTAKEVKGNQHFTQPPARFTEASLIKALEENGIGRPSTYAPTITTILSRNYIEREAKQLKPTPLGETTTKLMKEQFKQIVDVDFTANMEQNLDHIEEGSVEYAKMLRTFYDEFHQTLETAEKAMEGSRMHVPSEETDEVCEVCGKPMVIKIGRFGKFLACSGFPECRNTKRIVQESGGTCPKCGKRVLIKRSRTGKRYYGCEDNPRCDFMTWDEPMKDTCPKCGKSLFRRRGKDAKIYCAAEGCGYERGIKD